MDRTIYIYILWPHMYNIYIYNIICNIRISANRQLLQQSLAINSSGHLHPAPLLMFEGIWGRCDSSSEIDLVEFKPKKLWSSTSWARTSLGHPGRLFRSASGILSRRVEGWLELPGLYPKETKNAGTWILVDDCPKKKGGSFQSWASKPCLPVIALLVSQWVRLRLEGFFDELLHSSSWREKSIPGETCEPLCTWCKALDPPGLPWFIIVQCKTWPLFWVLWETTPFRRSQGFNVIPLNMFFPANCFLRFGNNYIRAGMAGLVESLVGYLSLRACKVFKLTCAVI